MSKKFDYLLDHGESASLLAIVLRKLGVNHVQITEADIAQVQALKRADLPCLVVHEYEGALHVKIMSYESAEAYARVAGLGTYNR